jgi:flagellar hook-associated protein 3 FlgL
MTGAVTLGFSLQAQSDFHRITQELSDLQRQLGSGARAQDLSGFGSATLRLLSARNLKASADARDSVLSQLDARLNVQSAALNQASGAASSLAQSIREAVSSGDGRGIATQLGSSFDSIVAALDESWNGQPLFAGERQSGPPIKVGSLQELLASTGPSDLFDEAQRRQSVSLSTGVQVELAPKASEISQNLFDTLKSLANIIGSGGGALGQPLTDSQNQQLLTIVGQLDAEANSLTTEEGRTGQLQTRFSDERTRLQLRSDLLTKEIGEQADADLAEVSVRLNTLMVQYQAAAKSFADLSKVSLLNYL